MEDKEIQGMIISLGEHALSEHNIREADAKVQLMLMDLSQQILDEVIHPLADTGELSLEDPDPDDCECDGEIFNKEETLWMECFLKTLGTDSGYLTATKNANEAVDEFNKRFGETDADE